MLKISSIKAVKIKIDFKKLNIFLNLIDQLYILIPAMKDVMDMRLENSTSITTFEAQEDGLQSI
jgi:hypothetical protein